MSIAFIPGTFVDDVLVAIKSEESDPSHEQLSGAPPAATGFTVEAEQVTEPVRRTEGGGATAGRL